MKNLKKICNYFRSNLLCTFKKKDLNIEVLDRAIEDVEESAITHLIEKDLYDDLQRHSSAYNRNIYNIKNLFIFFQQNLPEKSSEETKTGVIITASVAILAGAFALLAKVLDMKHGLICMWEIWFKISIICFIMAGVLVLFDTFYTYVLRKKKDKGFYNCFYSFLFLTIIFGFISLGVFFFKNYNILTK